MTSDYHRTVVGLCNGTYNSPVEWYNLYVIWRCAVECMAAHITEVIRQYETKLIHYILLHYTTLIYSKN
jgi:hypothetical protein